MKKIAIGWLGIQKDFINNSLKVNDGGPTANFLRYHYSEYSKYILLFTEEYIEKARAFEKFVKQYLPYVKLQLQIVKLRNVHQDIPMIKSSIEEIILREKDKEIDIFLSTGSGTMKIVWYIVHTTLGLNTRLVQILPIEESSGHIPELIIVKVEGYSNIPVSAIIREQIQENRYKPFLTKSLKNIYDKALKIAQTASVPVLIIGNTGTGKELLARFIHINSPRKRKPYKTVNTAAMSDQLLESRLFGYKKGCFTGAHKDFKGIFEQANGGTVFLDEIGDISPYMQQALLRLLQEGEIQPLCGDTKKVDVRIIAATNKSLKSMVKKGEFRSDLFYRLGIMLKLPDFKDYPYQEKLEFINYLITKKQEIYEKNIKLSKKVINFLLNYDYPGNIRELDNILDYLFILSEDTIAGLEALPPYIENTESSLSLKDMERIHIQKVLEIYNYNKTRAAKALGIAINTLKNKMKLYGIKDNTSTNK